ncbi:unnamed protein product [Oppiella nova]|uniref:NR LBD domain-containing protein n=1 Tax=Oppiella nova TaxID=334625 RepID=A0A7R9LEY3_9ACAR|nr:unnamed protein product [Oppiella nova]CAG2162875.1 unnamed protein product [Oppiella nova]
MIMNAEERSKRRLIIECNRLKRKKLSNIKQLKKTPTPHYYMDSASNSSSDNQHNIVTSTCATSSTSISIDNVYNNILDISFKSNDNCNEKLYERAFTLGMDVMSIARPITDYNTTFNELEGYKFTELISAANIMTANVSTNINTSYVYTFEDFLRVIDVRREYDIKNVVKVFERLMCASEICEQDKVILLKYGALEVHCMRSITYYDYDTQSWTANLTEPNNETHILFRDYVNTMYTEIDSDINVLNIMTAIVLFNPYRPGLKYKEIEMIMNAEARHRRRSIIECNRLKRKNLANTHKIKEIPAPPIICTESSDSSSLSSSDNHNILVSSTSSTCTSICVDKICDNNLVNTSMTSTHDSNEKLYERAFTLGMDVLSIARPITDYNTTFNELEGNRFTELISAANIMIPKLSTNINKTYVSTVEGFLRVIDIQRESDVKNVVKVFKRLMCATEICEQDKVILLKYGASEVHCMRCITYYDYDNQRWTNYLDDNNAVILSMDFVRQIEPDNETHVIFQDYVNKLYNDIDSDINVLNIMTAIVLFNPYRPGLKYSEIVK